MSMDEYESWRAKATPAQAQVSRQLVRRSFGIASTSPARPSAIVYIRLDVNRSAITRARSEGETDNQTLTHGDLNGCDDLWRQ